MVRITRELRRLAVLTRRECDGETRRRRRHFQHFVERATQPGGIWEPSHADRLRKITNHLRGLARAADAADTVRELLGPGGGCRVREIALRSTRVDEAVLAIRDLECRGRLPCKGFVYIAWRSKPLEFLYVGQAQSLQRVRGVPQHGKLGAGIAEARALSLVYPGSGAKSILRLEHAVLDMYEFAKGRLPKQNARGGSWSNYAGRGYVALEELAEIYKRVSWWTWPE
jgi:hypothetical protein